MKKTLLKQLPGDVPSEIMRFADGADIYDSSCSPNARVYFIDKGAGYYLKCAESGHLAREAEMTGYFHSKGLGAEVLSYITDSRDWMLTAAISGEDCTHASYLADPKRLCDTLALELRRLHELDRTDCPVSNRTAEYIAAAERNYQSGSYDSSHFPDSFGYRSADEAYAVLEAGRGMLKSDVLLHGDYCLPNVILGLNDWRLAGFIDVDSGGVGDRHIDLFWGAWSLGFNLGTDKYRDRFLDAYGRDKADEDILKIVAAAEVFG